MSSEDGRRATAVAKFGPRTAMSSSPEIQSAEPSSREAFVAMSSLRTIIFGWYGATIAGDIIEDLEHNLLRKH